MTMVFANVGFYTTSLEHSMSYGLSSTPQKKIVPPNCSGSDTTQQKRKASSDAGGVCKQKRCCLEFWSNESSPSCAYPSDYQLKDQTNLPQKQEFLVPVQREKRPYRKRNSAVRQPTIEDPTPYDDLEDLVFTDVEKFFFQDLKHFLLQARPIVPTYRYQATEKHWQPIRRLSNEQENHYRRTQLDRSQSSLPSFQSLMHELKDEKFGYRIPQVLRKPSEKIPR